MEGLLFLTLGLAFVASIALQMYGIYLGFKSKWYIGLAAILVPGFAIVTGITKFFFKKDLIKL